MINRSPTRDIPHFPVALYEVAVLVGTLVAETSLASVHVRAHKQAGHMDASDLIKALQHTLQGGGRPHMENRRSHQRAHPRIHSVRIGVPEVPKLLRLCWRQIKLLHVKSDTWKYLSVVPRFAPATVERHCHLANCLVSVREIFFGQVPIDKARSSPGISRVGDVIACPVAEVVAGIELREQCGLLGHIRLDKQTAH